MRKSLIGGTLSFLLVATVAISGCSSDSDSTAESGDTATEQLDGTDMEALIAAAQEEGELVAYWHSSRIAKAGEAFEAKYGIKVTGTKSSDTETTERVIREVDSGNVLADIIGYDDGARLATDLIPNGYVINYVPPAFADKIDSDFQDPLIYLFQPSIWGYNTESYPDGCPVETIWQLTEPEWKQRIHLLDPALFSTQIQWFAELEAHSDDLAKAYEDHYGKPLELTEENAGLEFIKRLADNEPTLHQGDEEIAAAVGVKGQTDAPMGSYTLGRFRDNEELDYASDYCELTPFSAFNQPTYTGIVKDAKHPNAARLFINFLMTDEGVSPWTQDIGAYSVISDLPSNPDNPYPSVDAWGDNMLNLVDTDLITERRRAISDFWTKVIG